MKEKLKFSLLYPLMGIIIIIGGNAVASSLLENSYL